MAMDRSGPETLSRRNHRVSRPVRCVVSGRVDSRFARRYQECCNWLWRNACCWIRSRCLGGLRRNGWRSYQSESVMNSEAKRELKIWQQFGSMDTGGAKVGDRERCGEWCTLCRFAAAADHFSKAPNALSYPPPLPSKTVHRRSPFSPRASFASAGTAGDQSDLVSNSDRSHNAGSVSSYACGVQIIAATSIGMEEPPCENLSVTHQPNRACTIFGAGAESRSSAMMIPSANSLLVQSALHQPTRTSELPWATPQPGPADLLPAASRPDPKAPTSNDLASSMHRADRTPPEAHFSYRRLSYSIRTVLRAAVGSTSG